MSSVKTIDEIYKSVESQIKKNDYNNIEKIACMIMAIAKERSFSSDYQWNSKENKIKMAQDVFFQEKIEDLNNPQMLCVTAGRILKKIAKEFNINIKFLGNVSGELSENSFDKFLEYEHIIPVYEISTGQYISTDVERHIDDIQTGRKWHHFGKKKNKDILIEMKDTDIDDIMKKIGYVKSEEDYLDFYIKDILENNLDILEKLNILMENTNLSEASSKLKSSADIFRFYKKIIKAFICNDHRVLSFGGRSYDIDDNKKFITGVYYNAYDSEKFWLWSDSSNKMIEISREYLESFIDEYNIKIYSGSYNTDVDKVLNMNSVKNKVKVNHNYNQFILK